jgi:hypothetical protein
VAASGQVSWDYYSVFRIMVEKSGLGNGKIFFAGKNRVGEAGEGRGRSARLSAGELKVYGGIAGVAS